MPVEPIRYYNRYSKTIQAEEVYGERWLRLAYDNAFGRLLVGTFFKRTLFSWFYGRRMSHKYSAFKVLPFIIKYNLDVDEFAKTPYDYKTFNEFFTRALKKSARPIVAGDEVAVLPADGRHLVFPNVDTADGFYVKGSKFSLAELLGEEGLKPEDQVKAAKYAGGAMVISRLCPVDYHRFHFPCAGVPSEPVLLNGPLYSVSPIALRRNVRYLAQNKRILTELESPVFGSVACLEVGATNVGSIVHTFVPGRAVAKGEEKGLFKFGGSCVITLFQPGAISFDADLVEQSRQHIETYARMGDRLGVRPV